jgi:uncharacterized damage-inducible protein DinB
MAQSARDQLIAALERESATTLRVFRAYPPDQSELRPAPVLRTARELAWTVVLEQYFSAAVLRGQISIPPGPMPPTPATLPEVIAAFEHSNAALLADLRTLPDDVVNGTVHFYVAPQTLADVPKLEIVSMLLNDQIHHRGQFSIYLRMAGARCPSIYGPTAEEPWF